MTFKQLRPNQKNNVYHRAQVFFECDSKEELNAFLTKVQALARREDASVTGVVRTTRVDAKADSPVENDVDEPSALELGATLRRLGEASYEN